MATDKDDNTTPNGTVDITLLSVTPQTENVKFYIKQYNGTATVQFNGCLDYKVNTQLHCG